MRIDCRQKTFYSREGIILYRLATMITAIFVLVVTAIPFSVPAEAEEKSADEVAQAQDTDKDDHHGMTADQVARELANPNNSLASLTFRNQYRWYRGSLPNAGDQDNYTLLFQPVFPFTMKPSASGGKANLFVRPAIPLLVDQPVFEADKADFKGVTALGDIGFDIGYGVTEKNGLLWAFGMVGTLPTATDSDVAGKQWRLGPEALFAKFDKWGLYGIFPSHQFDVGGWGKGSYSTTQVQFFLKFLPGGGWSVGTTPIMDYDWKESHGIEDRKDRKRAGKARG